MFLLDIPAAPFIIGYVVVWAIIGVLAAGAVVGAIFLIRKSLKKKKKNNGNYNPGKDKDNSGGSGDVKL